ncbi:gliding motility-associated C-terminal domain-containing protein [Chitinophaga sancti]|uniref:T9SS type B sorting domain-containing protein n=1 Tax=Chitinophaga sancti TaxID=1004 RepID=UPI003F7AD8A8
MHPFFRILILFCSLFHITQTRADTFIVTSNANSGAGTLREAIGKANANGTATIDYILFNLPGTTMDNRTIRIAEELPALSSNIEIDGTTQPGTAFGVSSAKVRLLKESFIETGGFYNILTIKSADHVNIYGLNLEFQGNANGAYCISIFKSTNIVIGAAGKGNVLNAADGLISSDVQQEFANSTGIRIAYNFLGILPDGVTRVSYPYSIPDIILWGAGDVEIDHNVMCTDVRIEEYYVALVPADKRNYKIHDNIGGGDYTASSVIGYASFSMNIYPQITATGYNDYNIEVKNNQILQGSFLLGGGYGHILMQGNKVNTDRTGTTRIGNGGGIELYRNIKGLVGGDLESEKNYISGGGISCPYDDHITIKKNSIFCNDGRGISSKETVFITSYTGTIVSGTSEPDAVIEVFEANKCSAGSECQGKVYLGSTVADANGKWSYMGTFPGEVVATATNKQGSTSEFTRATIDIGLMNITHVLCGKPGSIKGIKVTGAASVRWEDEAGNIVGNTAELTGVLPGKYVLRASISNDLLSECSAASVPITILDVVPKITTEQVKIVKPCNDSNGSISNMTDHVNAFTTVYKWLNEKDEVVGNYASLTNVPAGTYRLFAYCTDDCFAVSEPIVLNNQPPPTINVSAMVVMAATCQNNNGAITGISVTGKTPYTFRWLNDLSDVAGNQLNLLNIAPGNYQLELTDNSGCRSVTAAPVNVVGTGSISLDATNIAITPSGCKTMPGSVKGLLLNGADNYTWRNEGGDVVGNTVDLSNVVAGTYQLTATNHLSCSVQSQWYTIETAPPVNWSVNEDVHFPSCNESDGEILINSIQGGTVKTLRWTSNNVDIPGDGNNIINIGPGQYALYITDQNNCEQLVYTTDIPRRTAPSLTSVPSITDETCGKGNGSIAAPAINGESPFVYRWSDYNGLTLGTANVLAALKKGQFFLEVTDKYGCKVNTGAYEVNNVTADIDSPADISLVIGKGQSPEIKFTYTSPAIFSLYADANLMMKLYENQSGAFMLPPLFTDTKYYLTASVDICISKSAIAYVKVVDKTDVYVPSAFSPNGDGQNDLFRPKYVNIASIDYFKVYNRWGTETFSSNSLSAAWDGSGMPAGTYVYIISGKDLLGKAFVKQGSVLLIK